MNARNRTPILILLVTVLLIFPSLTMAAQNVYVRIDGETQNWIKGDSTVTGLDRIDLIEGFEYHHLMEIPPGGGALVDHQTVILTKPFDRSTPKLLRAMDSSELLTVIFHFFRPDPGGGGTEQEFYNVTLEDARIVSIEPLVPNTKIEATAPLLETERIRFSYDAIVYEWIIDGNFYRSVVPRP